ncbi:MAG: hypothetical protein P8176_06075 [Gammaproteobacteria bacterium]
MHKITEKRIFFMQPNMQPLASPPHRFDGPGRADYGNNTSTTAPDIEAAEPAQTRAGSDNAMRNATSGNEEGCLSKLQDIAKNAGSHLKKNFFGSAEASMLTVFSLASGAVVGAPVGMVIAGPKSKVGLGGGAAIGILLSIPVTLLSLAAISKCVGPYAREAANTELKRRELNAWARAHPY